MRSVAFVHYVQLGQEHLMEFLLDVPISSGPQVPPASYPSSTPRLDQLPCGILLQQIADMCPSLQGQGWTNNTLREASTKSKHFVKGPEFHVPATNIVAIKNILTDRPAPENHDATQRLMPT
jgi:hypothetical protein